MSPLSEAAVRQMADIEAAKQPRISAAVAAETAEALDNLAPWDLCFTSWQRGGMLRHGHVIAWDPDARTVRLLEISHRGLDGTPDVCVACGQLPEGRWETRQLSVEYADITEVRRLSLSARERLARTLWAAAAEHGAHLDRARTLAGWGLEITR